METETHGHLPAPHEPDDFVRVKPGASLRSVRPLFLLVLPLVAFLLFEGFARGSLIDALAWAFQRPMMLLLNYGLLAGVFWLFFLFRSNRARACASVVLTFLLSVVGIVSHYKINYRLEPVLFTDITQLGTVRTTLEEFPMDIRWSVMVLLVLGTLLALLLCCLLFRRRRAKRSMAWPLLGAVVFGLMLPFCTFDNEYVGIQTDLVAYSRTGGSLYTMMATERLRHSMVYSGYEPEDAKAAYQELQSLTAPDAKDTPNIIFILSESFIDEEHLSLYMDFAQPITPFYNQLAKTCISGDVYVPGQGGGTSETEFEVLTGLHSKHAVSPYAAGLPELSSVAGILRNRGYQSTALHWHTAVFYNRFRNLRQLGFDAFYTTDTTISPFERQGAYVSDAAHYRSILKTLRATPSKDFIYCITMQNHFPYAHYGFLDAYEGVPPFTNSLNDHNTQVATNYCYLLQQSDLALQSFIQQLSAFEEPTMVVFFSDHIPPLGNDFYEEIGMPVQTDIGHLVPYFIWSNQEDNAPQQVDMQAWQLGAFALEQAGITSDPFFRYIESLRQSGENGDERYALLVYDALYGEQAAYEGQNPGLLSERWESGGDVNLLRVYAEQLGDRVYILPQLEDNSQAVKLSVNGQMLGDWCIGPTDKPITIECVLSNSRGAVYNRSAAMTFSSTEDLLARTEGIPKYVIPLDGESYTITTQSADYLVVATGRKYAAQAGALMLGGQRQEWQPAYAVNRAGRFNVRTGNAFQAPQPATIAIRRADFQGYEMTTDGIREYMKDHSAELMLLGAYTVVP